MKSKRLRKRFTNILPTLRGWLLSRRTLRWGAILLCVCGLLWLAAWLGQRSLRTPARKRALQAWLDDTLNADVALLGDMSVRLNLVRDSRILLNNVEIEHPNPVFPGKLARIGQMGAWAPPWAVAGLLPGTVDFLLQDARVEIEQAVTGEWSHDGLMKPLAAGDTAFPFPATNMRHWNLDIQRGHIDLRRRGYEFGLDLNAILGGRAGRDSVSMRMDTVPLSFGRVGSAPEERRRSAARDVNLGLRLGGEAGSLPELLPGGTRANVTDLPVAMLPFLATGIPMEDSAGVFNGLVRYDKHPQAAGAVYVEGELRDAPLSVLGLPRTAPLRLNWPLAPFAPDPGEKLQADIRMGPSGFGAFTMTVPFGPDGLPEALLMRGDVAALDAVPGFFSTYSQWPDWLSRTFPRIEWRSGQWRGFGWEGENLELSLSRGAAGLNLTGGADLMGGRARLSMTPGQADTPVTLSAEGLDGARLAERLSRMLPEQFATAVRGSAAGMTWRGTPDAAGALPRWGAGMVWTEPTVDIDGSGSWWRSLARLPEAVAIALPEWGGGDETELRALAALKELELDQLSVVMEQLEPGVLRGEFRAFEDAFGQAAGIVGRNADGTVEGEILLTGASALLAAVERANPEFARVLSLLAVGGRGLRMAFRHSPAEGGEFIFPFLQDAAELRERLK